MSFEIRVLNKEYKEILILRSKISSLLKVDRVIRNEYETLCQQDVLYLPKPVLVYLLILRINQEKGDDLSIYSKHQKRAINALKSLLETLNNKKLFLEKKHKIEANQNIELIKIDNKVPRRVFTSPTHRQMAQEIMRKFRERNEKKEKK